MAWPHPPCNRMAQVQCVHIGDNVKYYPIITTDKKVAFKYFKTLKKDVVRKNTVQKPWKFTLRTVHTKILAWAAVVTKCTGSMEPVTTVSTDHPKNGYNIHVWGFPGTGQPTDDATVTALTLWARVKQIQFNLFSPSSVAREIPRRVEH